MIERNIELLEKTMQYIKDHPHDHNQGEWWCGTTGCFFGWAVHLSGLELEKDWTVITPGQWAGNFLPETAAELLGLTQDEAATLSNGGNTIAMLELMVKDLVNGDKLKDQRHYGDTDTDDDQVIFDEARRLL